MKLFITRKSRKNIVLQYICCDIQSSVFGWKLVFSLLKKDKDRCRRHAANVWCFHPLTFESHKGDEEAERTSGNTTEHETQLHLFSQTWNSPLVLGSRSWSKLAVHRPLVDSSQTLSHCRGFGTRISHECSNGLRVHLDPCWYFSVACHWQWNIHHVSLSRFVTQNAPS